MDPGLGPQTHDSNAAVYIWGFGVDPPHGGEAPSNVDLVMSVRELIHPKP